LTNIRGYKNMLTKYELVEIETIEEKDYNGYTYDLEVEEDHSYNVEGIIVHNSVCTTRLVAGVGMPQLSAIMECADAAHGLNGHIIGDGGCTTPGDIVKAFAGGADFVMLGGMFAFHEESEEEIIDGKIRFYGMSSNAAMQRHGARKDGYRSCEGKVVEKECRGPVENVVYDILGGLRSACTYVGARRLKDLSKCTTFVKVHRTHNTEYGNEWQKNA
jgi:GMP reductase